MIGFWFLLSVLAIVTTFGLGTTVNMIFKRWWLSMVLYFLLVAILAVSASFRVQGLEWLLLAVGALGSVLAALGARVLKKRGYPLFS